jgi:NADPH:quinone reductase-like Zn-dependent oxidoreductase
MTASRNAVMAPAMKVWACKGYGGPDVLALEDRPRPIPGDKEILVRIHASTVSSADVRVRSLNMPRGFGTIARLIFGFARPRNPILGTEFSGIIEQTGQRVTTFNPGDAVVGFAGGAMGCHAQYRVMAATKAVAPKPAGLSFPEAASLCFGGTTALHFLRKAVLKPGESVLVIGASGAVGVAMTQLAVHQGARVTAVTSTGNVELVRSQGASAVIDYSRADFTTLGQTFDVIADTVGASSFTKCLSVLNERGRYLAIAGDLAAMLARPSGTKRSIAGPAAERPEDVRELCRLAEAGVFRPVIDAVYDFSQMREAHARVDTNRKRGGVVVSHTATA